MRLILALHLAVLALPAHADGKVFSEQVALPVELPDQRALIVFRDGVETLVIETSYVGGGAELAWVVPLPALPTAIAPATTGLFPTLGHLCRPRLLELPGLWLVFWLEVLLVLTIWSYRSPHRAANLGGVGCLGLFLAAVFLPVLGGPKPPDPVTVHRMQTVGAYETVTLSAKRPGALVDWLEQRGYAPAPGLVGAVTPLVNEGWCFVASRLRPEHAAAGGKTHPLAFTFPTPRPIYPMRLTGFGASHSLDLELFVFADHRAEAPGFTVEHCGHTSGDARGAVPVFHEGLGQFAAGTTVCTHLTSTLSPGDMDEEVLLELVPFAARHTTVFPRTQVIGLGALLGIAAGIFWTLRWLSWSYRRRHGQGRRQLRIGAVLVLAMTVAPLLVMPTVQTHTNHMPRLFSGHTLYEDVVTAILTHGEPVDLETVQRLALPLAAEIANPITGESMQHEDSPGNYTLQWSADRETIDLLVHRANGRAEPWPVAAGDQLRKVSPEALPQRR